MPSCLTCEFFRNSDVIGNCRRYPAPQLKHQSDWCGEYMPNAVGEVLAPTVYDIHTDTTTKRGRKPKDASNPN